MAHPVHFPLSKLGLKVFRSMRIAPFGQAFATGQNGFMSHRDLSNRTDSLIGGGMVSRGR